MYISCAVWNFLISDVKKKKNRNEQEAPVHGFTRFAFLIWST